jgi:ATP-dependent RNA helicase DeaD
VAVLKETLRKELEAGELDLYVDVVTQLADEGPFDMADVAAAATRIAHGSRAQAKPVEILEPTPARAERPKHAAGGQPEEKVRLSMAVGKRDGIRPADVVGSIANEAGIPGRDIGPIDIRDDVTYVVVPRRYLDDVLEKVGRARFKGRPVNIRVATDALTTAPSPRRPAPRTAPPKGGAFKRFTRPPRPGGKGGPGGPGGKKKR